MHSRKPALLLAVPLVAVGLGAGAVSARAQTATANAKAAKAQAVRIVIKDVRTSAGSGPAFVGPNGVGARTLFTAHVGKPVVLTVVNKSTSLHSFTVSSLGLNSIIPVGQAVTIRFTPRKTGVVGWWCTPPCGPWVMRSLGYMRGYFRVAR